MTPSRLRKPQDKTKSQHKRYNSASGTVNFFIRSPTRFQKKRKSNDQSRVSEKSNTNTAKISNKSSKSLSRHSSVKRLSQEKLEYYGKGYLCSGCSESNGQRVFHRSKEHHKHQQKTT